MKLIHLIVLCFLSSTSLAQVAGSIDENFNNPDSGINANGIVYGSINQSLLLSNNTMLIGGDFSLLNGNPSNKLGKIALDGSTITEFNIGSGFDQNVKDFVELADGRVIVVGNFTIYNDTVVNSIVCLKTNGAIDTSFHTDPLFQMGGYIINTIQLFQDGSIAVGGDFGLLKLDEEGIIDSGFNFNPGYPVNVTAIHILNDNSVIVAGTIASSGGYMKTLPDGTIDPAFYLPSSNASGNGMYSQFHRILPMSSGEFLLCGKFDELQGQAANGAVRIDNTGAIVSNFGLVSATIDYDFQDALIVGDSIYIAGTKTMNNYAQGNVLLKIDFDGNLSATYRSEIYGETESVAKIHTISELPDEHYFFGGSFSPYSMATRHHAAILDENGKLDTDFNATSGPNSRVIITKAFSNGTTFIAGEFTSYQGQVAYHLAKLDTDGNLDENFLPETSLQGTEIIDLVEMNDGAPLVGYNYNNQGFLKAYNPGGSVNTGFNTTFNSTISAMYVQNDGKIIVAGNFNLVNGQICNKLVRLNTDGTRDNTFSSGSGPNDLVKGIRVQSTGKILLNGNFTSVNGTPRLFLARLEVDGSLDPDFNSGSGFNGGVDLLEVQGDDRIILYGSFSMYNGASVPGATFRMLVDGEVDPTFLPNFGFSGVREMQIGTDGALYLNTYLSGFDRLIKIKPNGHEDTDFQSGITTDDYLFFGFDIQSDGKIVLGGNFTEYQGEPKTRIVRINNTSYAPELLVFTTPSHSDSCNAEAYVSITGISNFTFDIGNGETVVSNGYAMFDSLCPGIYSASAIDGMGNVFYTTYVVPSDSTHLMVNPISNAIDTVVAIAENCDIEYADIDTLYIDSYIDNGVDSILVTWAVVTATDTNYVDAQYVFGPAGNYLIQLQLYCPEKAMGNYFVVTQGITYLDPGLSILSYDELLLNVYPNPTSGEFTIASDKEVAVMISDLTGNIVYSSVDYKSSFQVSNLSLNNGLYLILVQQKGGLKKATRKISIIK